MAGELKYLKPDAALTTDDLVTIISEWASREGINPVAVASFPQALQNKFGLGPALREKAYKTSAR